MHFFADVIVELMGCDDKRESNREIRTKFDPTLDTNMTTKAEICHALINKQFRTEFFHKKARQFINVGVWNNPIHLIY